MVHSTQMRCCTWDVCHCRSLDPMPYVSSNCRKRKEIHSLWDLYVCFSKLLRFDICHDVFSSLNAAKIVQVDWFVAKTCTCCCPTRRCPLLRCAHLSDFFLIFFKILRAHFRKCHRRQMRATCTVSAYAVCTVRIWYFDWTFYCTYECSSFIAYVNYNEKFTNFFSHMHLF